jgi:hypothetical protein
LTDKAGGTPVNGIWTSNQASNVRLRKLAQSELEAASSFESKILAGDERC